MCCWVAYSWRLCCRRHHHGLALNARGDHARPHDHFRHVRLVVANSGTARYMQDPAIEDSSDSCARSPSHIPGPPGESWDRSAPDALHWSVSARRGTETCVPSACRNRPSSSQWCNGRATFVCGAWHLTSRAYTAGHWRRQAAMSRYTDTRAPRAGIEPARELVRASDLLRCA